MNRICQIGQASSAALRELLAPLQLDQCVNYEVAIASGYQCILLVERDDLYLMSQSLGKNSRLHLDFFAGKLGHRRQFGGGKNQDICRAVGLSRTTNFSLCDATAGLGSDAFIFACQGAQVTAIEKNPVLSAMLDWAKLSALSEVQPNSDSVLQAALNRLQFIQADSCEELKPESFDVVYMDPMFPDRDKSAKVKKEMQILQQLLMAEDMEEQELFQAGWRAARSRLVIKRPVKAPPFALVQPSHQIVGKTIRFDLYIRKALPGPN